MVPNEKGIRAARVRIYKRHDNENNDDVREANSNNTTERLRWSKHLSVLLAGTRDTNSSLYVFRGFEDVIIREIYTRLTELWATKVIQRTPPASSVGRVQPYSLEIERPSAEVHDKAIYRNGALVPVANVIWKGRSETEQILGCTPDDRPEIAYSVCGCQLEFPPPQDININMMPFILGHEFSLPEYLQHYHDIIMECPISTEEMGKVCYLTVSEGHVENGQTQRRPGLHIEAPYGFKTSSSFAAGVEHHWGQGVAFGPDEFHGGIYMASTLASSCVIYDALVVDKDEVDHHGGMDHLRPYIGEPYFIEANELVWFTDRTPHEALPQNESGYRQYFRLVTSNISFWFANHSTPNPNVPVPDNVSIINGNKFDGSLTVK